MNKIIENAIKANYINYEKWIEEDVEGYSENGSIHIRGRYDDMYRLYILKDVKEFERERYFKRMGLNKFL